MPVPTDLTPFPALSSRQVLVVDDHDLIRLGLRSLSAHLPGLVIREARSLREALQMLQHAPVDTVLLDLRLPDAHGLTALTTMRERFPALPVVVLSGDSDPGLAARSLAAGALAFLPKSGDLQPVLDLLQHGLVPPVLPAASAPGGGDPADPRTQLSPRQHEVLDWLLAGHSNRDIAQRMHIGEGTVKNHVSTLLLTFGVRSRAELISSLR